MKRTIKIALAVLLLALCAGMLAGCSEASKVNHNISSKARYFECERRITVYNARTDKITLIAEGYKDISTNDTIELEKKKKTGASEYKKNYVYLNAYTMYVVEDITGTHADPYHYVLQFHTNWLPEVEVR